MSEPSEYPLHQAALNGDTDTLNHLLAEGTDVDDRDADGRTPLFCAARNGETIAARYLLKYGARIDCETLKGTTALMTAARGGHAETVRLLLANGADPNQIIHPQSVPKTPEEQARRRLTEAHKALRDLRGMPDPAPPDETGPIRANTLAIGIMSRDMDTVRALLDAGADLDCASGPVSITPLKSAINIGGLEFVRAVVDRGVNINENRAGEASNIASAVVKRDIDIARFLLEHGARPDADALTFAIIKDQIDMVKLLLEFGADPDAQFRESGSVSLLAPGKPEILALFAKSRGTDWHESVIAGDLPAVRARLDAGCVVNARNSDSETALILAADAGQSEIVDLLLQLGAGIEACDKFQVTALMRAVKKGHADVVRLLLASGANVNATNQWGQTALHTSPINDRANVRKLLIEAGATVGIVEATLLGDSAEVLRFLAAGVPVDQPNSTGMTALMAAASKGSLFLAIVLLSRGADVSRRHPRGDTAFTYAIENACRPSGDTALLVLLLDRGADINGVGHGGSSPLSAPILLGSEKILRFLIDRGADPKTKSEPTGCSMLDMAIRSGRAKLPILEILLECGVEIDAVDHFGATPLMTTVALSPTILRDEESGRQYIRAMTGFLIEHGADVNARNEHGAVLELAVEAGDIEIVRLLLDAGSRSNGSSGLNPLVRATFRHRADIAALLRERGASDRTPEDAEAGIAEGMLSAMVTTATSPDLMNRNIDETNEARRKQTGSL